MRRGIALWREAGAPYETARARLLLGEALERHGDRRHALVEFDAARAALERYQDVTVDASFNTAKSSTYATSCQFDMFPYVN